MTQKSIPTRYIIRTGLAALLILAIFTLALPTEADTAATAQKVEKQSKTQLDRVLEELGDRSIYVVPGDILGRRSNITRDGLLQFYDPQSKAITNMNQFNNSLNSTVSGIMRSAQEATRFTP